MDHSICKYFFEGEMKRTKTFYNNLKGLNDSMEYKEQCNLCGLSANAVEIKDGQPLCGSFKEIR